MSEIKKQWYVIRAVGGKENKVKEYIESEIRHNHLEDYISQILIPTEKVYTIRNGKKISKEKVSYPGYVLIEAAFVGQIPIIIRNTPNVLGFLGDVVQIALSGTTGLGSMLSGLLNTGYNIYSGNRQYEASRADNQWNQQMQEKQYQDKQNQQLYENEFNEREYRDKLNQQQFNNDVTNQKLNIALGEWNLKKSTAAQKASQAGGSASGSRAGSSGTGSTGTGSSTYTGAGLGSTGSGSGSVTVPYTAMLMRSQGRSDSSITGALQREGYSNAEIAQILQQMKR